MYPRYQCTVLDVGISKFLHVVLRNSFRRNFQDMFQEAFLRKMSRIWGEWDVTFHKRNISYLPGQNGYYSTHGFLGVKSQCCGVKGRN